MKGFRLEINTGTSSAPAWQEVVLADNQSISIEKNSQLWSDTSSFAYGLTIPLHPNKHLLGTSDEMFGSSIYAALYKKPARLWVGGTIFFSGKIDMDDEVEITDDGIEINLISGRKSFNDMLDGVNAQDVEIFFGDMRSGHRKDGTLLTQADKNAGEKDNKTLLAERFPGKNVKNVPIGWATPRVSQHMNIGARVAVGTPRYDTPAQQSIANAMQHIDDTWKTRTDKMYKRYVNAWTEDYQTRIPITFEMPQFMMPYDPKYPDSYDRTNTSLGYVPGESRYDHPYCNISLCAQKYVQENGSSWERRRGYTDIELGPKRYNSSPCFFVLFWLEQLLDIYLDLHYDISPLTDIQDMRYLCFVNKKCMFESVGESSPVILFYDELGVMNAGDNPLVATGASNFLPVVEITDIAPVRYGGYTAAFYRMGSITGCFAPQIMIYGGGKDTKYRLEQQNMASAENAYATSGNFPDVDASEVITSLENAFGFKFIYDEETGRLSVCFYRNVLTKTTAQPLRCVVSKVHKRENLKTGFRLKYSSSKAAEQNVFTKEQELVQGSEDTTYNYNDYRYVSMIQNAGRNDYVSMIKQLGSYDETLYISQLTGNAFRIKVDKDAKSESKWYPSLFEVGGYRDVEYGLCEDDGVFHAVVDEKSIGFSPVMVNDVNYENEKQCATDSEAALTAAPVYKLFVDQEMHPTTEQDIVPAGKHLDGSWAKEVIQTFASKLSLTAPDDFASFADALVIPSVEEGSQLEFRYNFTFPQGKGSTDRNCNPFNDGDSDFVLGFLRPGKSSGSDMIFSSENYDEEGHAIAEYRPSATGGCITADSVDVFGQSMGDLSLKLKAEKPLRSANGRTADEKPYDANGNLDYEVGNPRYYPVDGPGCANRGLFDRCWAEYAWFITHCKVAILTIPPGGIELIDLLAMRDDEWYTIGEHRGLLSKYSVNIEDGELGEVTIELLYI